MAFRLYFLLHLLFILTFKLNAQDLEIFYLNSHENINKETITFVSLSDIYPLSDHQDSLAIPDLSEKGEEQAKQFESFRLSSKYRQQFLTRTKISETDKVFIYSYSKNKLISFPVSSLNVVACLNIYGADWPYSQFDFMIGFEIDKRFLTDFDQYFENTLVCIGKKNPFVVNQMKSIVWQKIENDKIPLKDPISYDTSYSGKSILGNTYKYEMDGLLYYLQDFLRVSDNSISLKRLFVIETKTQKVVCSKMYYSGESSSFATLDNQWTGKLFKNKPSIILGFKWVSFGCPSIEFLSNTGRDIYTNCDNRH